ncbi:MAG: MBL fold metallo-hydrolase [Nitrospira sp. CG24E]|nr:MAG: MBL fold metallo-hydrolase [Nitrospira sp. CG24E]
MPLNVEDSIQNLPPVKGFLERNEHLLGVVISHPHQDHYGLSKYLLSESMVFMGAATERILKAATLFTPSGVSFKNVVHLESGKPLSVGPFTVTPYLNDHSAYDAYSLLIDADGRRLFYSGDFRGHGRKAGAFQRILKHPPTDVDVLLMEGTTIGRSGVEAKFQTEEQLEACFVRHMQKSKGMVLAWTSGQNIDRLVTIFKACKKSSRQLILDLYTAEILRVTGNPKLPQGFWKGIRVFLPASQKRQVIKNQQFGLVDEYRKNRIYPSGLAEEAARSVLIFRPSMAKDLGKAECLKDARLIYSLWSGYLRQEKMRPFHEWLKVHQIPLTACHTSGHASLDDLQRFAKAIAPKTLVPIHSFETKRFEEFFANVKRKQDGEWWEVP